MGNDGKTTNDEFFFPLEMICGIRPVGPPRWLRDAWHATRAGPQLGCWAVFRGERTNSFGQLGCFNGIANYMQIIWNN
jgi:hypothetical protein